MPICTTCNKDKPPTEFNKDKDKKRRCKQCNIRYLKEYRMRNRLEALQAYGGENPKCSCPGCGESHVEFLCIDHINGGGRQHYRQLRAAQKRSKENLRPDLSRNSPGGGEIYRWLKKNGYPPGYRVLCYNCNTARLNGPCPVHESISCLETEMVVETDRETINDTDRETINDHSHSPSTSFIV